MSTQTIKCRVCYFIYLIPEVVYCYLFNTLVKKYFLGYHFGIVGHPSIFFVFFGGGTSKFSVSFGGRVSGSCKFSSLSYSSWYQRDNIHQSTSEKLMLPRYVSWYQRGNYQFRVQLILVNQRQSASCIVSSNET